jgi:myosin heavy subunit
MYTQEIVQQYIGRTKGDALEPQLEPHLFGIAEDAYAAMVFDGKGQTIIVSGESGAGKTESVRVSSKIARFLRLIRLTGEAGHALHRGPQNTTRYL